MHIVSAALIQNDGERGRFRRGGQQPGHGRGRAFVHVGRVHLKRRGDHFEAEPDEHHSQAQHHQRAGRMRGQVGVHLVEPRGAHRAIQHRDAVQEKSGGERAQKKIFQRRFVGFQ
jgi:hypothetical protein